MLLSNGPISEYISINSHLSSDGGNYIVKGDVTKNIQVMIKMLEDVEGSRLRNIKGFVLWNQKGTI